MEDKRNRVGIYIELSDTSRDNLRNKARDNVCESCFDFPNCRGANPLVQPPTCSKLPRKMQEYYTQTN